MMYCTSCGHALGETDRFCPQCGAPTGREEPRPTFASPSGKRLVRLMREKSIAGVCAGFADYLEIDITLMRIIWLCTAIFTGVGFIAYLICWIIMPKDYSPAPAVQAQPQPAAARETPPPPGSEAAAESQ